jgi:L-iditol 2-dehydrogenase
LCDNRQVLGVSCDDYRRYGAFAELVAVPEHIVYRLPDELPLSHAALIEAVSVAVHATHRANIGPGDSAVVVGVGMIGLLVVQAIRARGVDTILAIDIDGDRLALAKQLGATHAIDSRDSDTVSQILKQANGGASHTFEVVGTTTTINLAIAAARKGGVVTLVGNVSPKIELPLQAVVTRELTLHGSCASQGEYPECIELMASGSIDVAPLLSATTSLDNAPEWFDRLYNREPGLMKVVVEPNGSHVR